MSFRKIQQFLSKLNKIEIIPRLYSATTEFTTIPAEVKMQSILKQKFPLAHSIQVVDVSGGCGAMYEISVTAPEFKGLSIVKQHMLINEVLKQEIKEMHGLRIHTEIPK
uniref:BolA-like protein 3 n=1 Tax=Clastoptera arizonana TaxID=38151 RepID=A0A1B6D398_9HEMI